MEEIQSRGSLPAWRRDGDNGHSLRITKRGLRAIRANDEATAADELPKKLPARPANPSRHRFATRIAPLRPQASILCPRIPIGSARASASPSASKTLAFPGACEAVYLLSPMLS